MRTEHDGGHLPRWLELADDLGLEEAAYSIFSALQEQYEEDGRHYHNLDHIGQVLESVGRLAPYAEDLAAVKLAAWFHDAIYQPGAADNEARSARFLQQTAQLHPVRAVVVEEAARLILLTDGHQAAPGDGNGQVLLDADLAILGADAAAYDRYAQAIRREFGHVPEAAYRRGRASILRRLLERDPLFNTPPMRKEREARARRNLRGELAALGDG